MKLRRLPNKVLGRFGLRLSKLDVPDAEMLNAQYADRLAAELTDIATSFLGRFQGLLGSVDRAKISDAVVDFLALYRQRPIRSNTSGSGFNNCFWIYLTVRLLKPELIVESGVWKGQTSWLMHQASPSAAIHGFDINLSRLAYKADAIAFHEMDWTGFDLGPVDPSKSICFFDCHVNQARRIREAYDRGFRILLFDDNPPVHKLYSFGTPGLPTVDMLLDETVGPGDEIVWTKAGVERRYLYAQEDEHGAKDLVAYYGVFPDVGGTTRYGGFTFLSLVGLIEQE